MAKSVECILSFILCNGEMLSYTSHRFAILRRGLESKATYETAFKIPVAIGIPALSYCLSQRLVL